MRSISPPMIVDTSCVDALERQGHRNQLAKPFYDIFAIMADLCFVHYNRSFNWGLGWLNFSQVLVFAVKPVTPLMFIIHKDMLCSKSCFSTCDAKLLSVSIFKRRANSSTSPVRLALSRTDRSQLLWLYPLLALITGKSGPRSRRPMTFHSSGIEYCLSSS